MTVFRYDKTFEGLLSAVFDAYVRKEFPQTLISEGEAQPMFAESIHTVYSDREKADRVWSSLQSKISKQAGNMLLHVWLSEEKGSDELLLRFIRKAFDTPHSIAENFADPDVLEIKQLAMKVSREAEHVRQFVRFQKGTDGTYFAPVAPKYNALPIAIRYFKDRFADQKWLIYDTKRHYGYYYDLEKAVEVTMEEDAHLLDGKLSEELLDRDEKLFQQMWKSYFKAMTIKERINPKLHRQHMPQRFWKYLTEKQ